MSNDVVDDFHMNRIPGLDEKRAQVVIDIVKQDCENARPRVMDIGCGAGEVTRLLAGAFDHVIGVDASSTQITKALEIPSSAEFITGTGEDLPVDNGTIDVITSMFSLHYMDVPKFAEECKRALKPGGFVVCYMDTTSKISSVINENLPDTSLMLKQMYDKYFEIFKVFQHPQMHIIDRFKALTNSTGGLNSKRMETKIENFTNLEAVKRHQLSIPIYGWRGTTTENPMVELIGNIKKLWSMENLENQSIKVKVTYDASIIILNKE